MTNQTPKKRLVEGPAIVVDDDESARRDLKDILERSGVTVFVQESASHAVRFLQNQPWNWRPGMIFTDLVMDGMGGYQFIRRVLELYPKANIPIIVVSKLDAGVDVGEAEIAGAHGYITKPFDETRLLGLVEKVTHNEKRGMVFHHDLGHRRPSL